jgi:hypothetical protein
VSENDVVHVKVSALRELLDERDRRYEERDRDFKNFVNSTFLSNEKAIAKAEQAQRDYNVAHNDLARKLDEQNKATIPRAECEARFRGLEENIVSLREAVTSFGGVSVGTRGIKDEARANFAVLISVASVVIAIISVAAMLMR